MGWTDVPERYDHREMPEEIERIFSDYKMNLVQVRDSGQYTFHNEDVRTVFEISREIFQGNFEKINREYKDRDINQELIRVIAQSPIHQN